MNHFWLRILPGFVRHRLEGRHAFQRLIDNTGWLMFDQMFRYGLTFLIAVWIARYLGPQDFGVLSYALAFVAAVGAISPLGVDTVVVVREVVRFPPQEREIFASAFGIRLLGGVIAYALAMAIIMLLRPDDRLAQWMIAILGFGLIFRAFEVVDAWFQAKAQVRYVVLARNVVLIGTTSIKAVLILVQAPLIAFAWAGLLDVALGGIAVLALYLLRETASKEVGCLKKEWMVSLLRDSWPLLLSTIVYVLYVRIDQIMLKEMLDDRTVGLYSAVAMISEVWVFLPAAITTAVFPTIVRTRQESSSLYYDRLQKLFDVMVCISLPIAVVITLLSEFIVSWTYGLAYLDAVPILQVHIWSTVFAFLLIASAQHLVAENMMKFAFFRNLLGAISKISLNLFLIPRYGAIGAAYATVGAYFVSTIVSDAFQPRTRLILLMKTRAIVFHSFWRP